MTSHPLKHQSEGFGLPQTVSDISTTENMNLWQLVRIAWRRKWLILLGAVAGVALGAIYYTQTPPVYRSQAQILVIKKQPYSLKSPSRQFSYLADDVPMHMALITSPFFIGSTVDRFGLASLSSLADAVDPTEAIIESLSVASETDQKRRSPNSILSLAYSGEDPEDCQVILSAIIQSYEDFLQENNLTTNQDALTLITQKAETVREELRGAEAEYQELRRRMPLIGDEHEGPSLWEKRLAEIEASRLALKIRLTETEMRLATIKEAVERGENYETLVAIVPEEAKPEHDDRIEQALLPLVLEEKKLLQSFGERHPEVRAIREQIRFTMQCITPAAHTQSSALALINEYQGPPSKELVDNYVGLIEREAKDIAISVAALDEQLEQERTRAKEIVNHELAQKRLSSDIARSKLFYESLIQQLQEVDINKDLLAYSMSVIAPPGVGELAAPNAWLVFTLAVFLGIQVGFVLVYRAEMSAGHLETPAQIRDRLALPVVGYIPSSRRNEFTRQSNGANGNGHNSPRCTYYWAESEEVEAYRDIRTALYVNSHGRQHQIIQVTSPGVKDGTAAVTVNLAASMAQSGNRILVVDADLRSPCIHQMFGITPENGLTSLLLEQAEPSDVVRQTDDSKLFILPSGPLPTNPSDLLSSPRFGELLECLRGDYDFVLVHSPALLEVADPLAVTASVDAILLTIRAGKTGHQDAKRATRVLEHLGPKVLGVVVNGVETDADQHQQPHKSHVSAKLYHTHDETQDVNYRTNQTV